MPKRMIPLSDIKVQKAKAKNKNITLFDGINRDGMDNILPR
jgi:hypothetical protein